MPAVGVSLDNDPDTRRNQTTETRGRSGVLNHCALRFFRRCVFQ